MDKNRKYTEAEVRAAYAAAAVKMFDLEVGTLSVYDEYGRLDVAATDAARAKEIAEIELGNKILERTYIVYSDTFHAGSNVADPEADSEIAIIGFGYVGTEQIFRKVGLKLCAETETCDTADYDCWSCTASGTSDCPCNNESNDD